MGIMKRDIRTAQDMYWQFGDDDMDSYIPSGREERDEAKHTTKDGQIMKVKDMDDSHLFHSYLCIGEEKYLKEMILRLFEERLKDKTKGNRK